MQEASALDVQESSLRPKSWLMGLNSLLPLAERTDKNGLNEQGPLAREWNQSEKSKTQVGDEEKKGKPTFPQMEPTAAEILRAKDTASERGPTLHAWRPAPFCTANKKTNYNK